MEILDLEALLALAVSAAQKPAQQIVQWFEADLLAVEHKGDGSPVTIADREAETTIRKILSDHPMASSFDILGEEYGQKEQGSRYRWLIDPIDGTRSFVNHIPLFGTIVALEDTVERTTLIGVIHLPVLKRTFGAARGLGAHCDGDALWVASPKSIKEAMIATGDIAQFMSVRGENTYKILSEHCPYLRTYTDCFGHAMVVSGAVSAMLDPALNPWDAMATQVLVEEAGGTMLMRPSTIPHKIDALFGTPSVVEELKILVEF
jgi:histidinol-phosphatase